MWLMASSSLSLLAFLICEGFNLTPSTGWSAVVMAAVFIVVWLLRWGANALDDVADIFS